MLNHHAKAKEFSLCHFVNRKFHALAPQTYFLSAANRYGVVPEVVSVIYHYTGGRCDFLTSVGIVDLHIPRRFLPTASNEYTLGHVANSLGFVIMKNQCVILAAVDDGLDDDGPLRIKGLAQLGLKFNRICSRHNGYSK